MVQVSIADPSELVRPMSDIDIEAMKKTTSIYLSTHVIHMLPTKLSTDLVSLNHQKTRLSQTVQIEFDENMDVVSSNIFESKFYNKNRFDYESFSNQFMNIDSEYHFQFDLLYEIAKKLYNKRMKK
jgi:ribonuclease R